MDLSLTEEQATELRTVVSQALGDLSHEIADTDNAEYRRTLRERRELLEAVQKTLGP